MRVESVSMKSSLFSGVLLRDFMSYFSYRFGKCFFISLFIMDSPKRAKPSDKKSSHKPLTSLVFRFSSISTASALAQSWGCGGFLICAVKALIEGRDLVVHFRVFSSMN